MAKKRAKFAPMMVPIKRRQAILAKPTFTATKDLARLMAEVPGRRSGNLPLSEGRLAAGRPKHGQKRSHGAQTRRQCPTGSPHLKDRVCRVLLAFVSAGKILS